jgi:hypothetical protein
MVVRLNNLYYVILKLYTIHVDSSFNNIVLFSLLILFLILLYKVRARLNLLPQYKKKKTD